MLTDFDGILDRFDSSESLDAPSSEVIQAVSFDAGIVEIVELQGIRRQSIRLTLEASANLFEKLKEIYA